MSDHRMTHDELISQARQVFADVTIETALDACEAFYMSGSADEVSGDVDTYVHFYRVHRWIVRTDSQGFRELDTYNTEADAREAFETLDRYYIAGLEG